MLCDSDSRWSKSVRAAGVDEHWWQSKRGTGYREQRWTEGGARRKTMCEWLRSGRVYTDGGWPRCRRRVMCTREELRAARPAVQPRFGANFPPLLSPNRSRSHTLALQCFSLVDFILLISKLIYISALELSRRSRFSALQTPEFLSSRTHPLEW
jgi:hypothetical protein